MAIQIGKYKRPGIFIEEFDKSVISSPVVEGITNLIIGVSKKGPVNTPIRLTTVNDLESIFGTLDRGLERKGSFFHRTIAKMLESSAVFAMNLLTTDDTLDVIEYKSLSAAAGYNNDIEREGPYRRFFDTTGFWKRDTESFINLTKSNVGYSDRAFSLTNLSDKYITAFVVKSSRTGFDRTLIEWYGSQEKLPPFVNANDYASDYMVDVVVVGGDWSNYQELSIDNRWSAYFNSSGLVKSQLRSFANDRNITLLAYYEGLSLIPYFRDANGTNVFIETVINRDTDRTGLFCAFNADLVEEDFYNGKLDLVGQTIAGVNEADIEYLSYKETIAESIEITAVPLDLPGNVTALSGGSYGYSTDQDGHAFDESLLSKSPKSSGVIDAGNANNRTYWFGEGFVNGITEGSSSLTSSAFNITYNVASGAFAVIGNKEVPISGTVSLTVSNSDFEGVSSSTQSFSSAFVLDSTGQISVVTNTTGVTTGIPTNPAVSASDIVLGYATYSRVNGNFVLGSENINRININSTGFVDFLFGTMSGNDYHIATQSTAGSFKVEFLDTANVPSTAKYEQFRRFKMFYRLIDLIDSANKDKMVLNLGKTLSYKKKSMTDMTISNIVTASTSNKSFILNTGLSNSDLVDIKEGFLCLYTIDNEFIIGENGVQTTEDAADINDMGVAGLYSKFYSRFYDGIINTGDYFHRNRVQADMLIAGRTLDVIFIDGEDGTNGNVGTMSATSSFAGYNYVIFVGSVLSDNPDFSYGDQFVIGDSELNKGSFTVINNSSSLASSLGYTNTSTEKYFAFQVNEEVVYEEKQGITTIFDYINKTYLKMYLDNDGLLEATFWDDETFTGNDPGTNFAIKNNTIFIQSAKSNYKQTIEIELPAGYVQVPNKILVKSNRYTEVRIGDFLSAYYDPTSLAIGEAPRKLTRILSKKQYSGDSSLVEITCDARIALSFAGDALQATRYASIDNYVSTYKAISLKGFRIRTGSLPDGTEARQNSILNMVAKGTPLFKALTNKEAIDFRYLIDSFGLGLTERSKQQLVDICGERKDALGILNMPSMKSFKNSSSPSFVNSEGVLQIEYVAKGGDPESSPAFLYSFGDGEGATCVGYFAPYVTVNDNGRPVDVPPSAFVGTTYMRKHNSIVAGISPWTIAAGVTNGRILNIVATEQDFTNTDIEYLNEAQMNPIVFKRNRGNVIETENTAQTLFRSALSYLHVREVLIELERELSRMLLEFQWQFNTPDIRAEIKLRADVICETYVSRNGLFNYFNKMDEENNTPDIIDNQIGVLDTYVEPIKGMGIIVNNITILRTGAISAGGFLNG
jgi:hypothetical protein